MALRRKLAVGAGILASAILILLTISLAWLHTSSGERFALEQFTALLNASGVRFSAARLDYNLLAGRITLHDVMIAALRASDLPPVFRAGQVTVDASLWKLAGGVYHIDFASIIDPRIELVFAGNGTDNIPRGKGGGGSRDLPEVFLRRLDISRGSFHLQDMRLPAEVSLPGWHASVQGNASTRLHDVRFALDRPGMVSVQERKLPVDVLSLAADANTRSVTVRELRLATGRSSLTASGSVPDLNDPKIQARLAADLSLEQWTAFAGTAQKASGRMQVNVSASGPPDELDATATVAGAKLQLDRLRGVDLAAVASYRPGSERVQLSSFSVSSPLVNASAKGTLALTAKAGRSSAELLLKRLDLERLGGLYSLPIRIASTADGQVRASFPALRFDEARANAELRLARSRDTVAKGILPVDGSFDASVQGKRADLRIQSLETAGIAAQGEVRIAEDQRLTGNVLAKVALGRALDAMNLYQGKPQAPESPAAGEVELTANLGGQLGSPVVDATVRAPSIRAGGLDQIALNASVRYASDLVTLNDSTIRWRDQAIQARGTMGLKEPRPIDFGLRTQAISLPVILAGAGRTDLKAAGTLDLDAKLTGTVAEPQGHVSLIGAELGVLNQPLGNLNAQISAAGDVVRLDTLQLQKEGGQSLTASGAYGLKGQEIALKLQADDFQMRRLVLPNGTPLQVDLSLAADVKGTRKDPEGEATFQANNLVYGGESVGEIAGKLQLRNQEAGFQLRAPAFNLATSGTVAVNAPYTSRIELSADSTNLETLPFVEKRPIKGTLSANIQATGPLATPAKLEAAGRADLNIEWREQPIRTSIPLMARFSGGLLSIDQGAVTAAGSTLNIAGSIPFDQTATGDVRLNGTLDLGGLAKLAPASGFEAQGTAKLDARIRGNLKEIDPQVTLTAAGVTVKPPNLNPATNINLDLRLQDGVAKEHLTADWASARIESTGTIPLGLFSEKLPIAMPAQSGAVSLTADVKNLDLSSIQETPRQVAGKVSLHLEAEAAEPRIQAVEGKLSFPELELKLGGFDFRQSTPSLIALRGGTARIEQFKLQGPETQIGLAGSIGITGDRPIDLQLTGNFDAAIAAAFSDTVRANGPVELSVKATGTVSDPQLAGLVTVSGGSVGVSQPRIAADDLNARIKLDQRQAVIERLDANLNGGKLTGKGAISLAKGTVNKADISVTLDDVYLDYPPGFQTMSNGTVTLRGDQGEYVLGGKIAVVEGSYTEPLTLDRGLLAYVTSDQSRLELEKEPNPTLQRARFDLAVESKNPLIVDNNLAKLGINMDLRLVGGYYEPGMVGRVTLDEGGELRFSERTYIVDRGVMTFANERRIDPALDIVATTKVNQYDVSMTIQGGGGSRVETTLTSEPPLPEPDILSLLLTGRLREDVRGSEVEVAGRQALSLLTGGLTSRVGEGLQRITGLSQVRVEPSLIAAEEDPTARLTVGQDITSDLSLVYSMDLTNSSDQVYIAEYDLSRRFVTRGIRQDDNSYRFEFNHDLRFGDNGVAKEEKVKRQPRRITAVEFVADTPIPEPRLRDEFGLEPGDEFDFFQVRRRLDRLHRMHLEQDLLEARVGIERREQGRDQVALTVKVDAGPAVDFVYEGWDVPGEVRDRVKQAWQSGFFDIQRVEDASWAIRSGMMKDGFLRAQVGANVAEKNSSAKRVLFEIQPGIRYGSVEVVFEGARNVEPDDLKKVLKQARLEDAMYVGSKKVTETLTAYYHEQGYLDAEIKPPRVALDEAARSGRIVIDVREGPKYRIGRIRFAGNNRLTDPQIRESILVRPGDDYAPSRRADVLKNIRGVYENNGFLDTVIQTELQKRQSERTVDLIYLIIENRQSVVEGIQVAGNVNTSDGLIWTQMKPKPGQPLTPEGLSDSRRNLYRTEAFQTIDINRSVLNPDAVNEPKRVALDVRVREVKPFQTRYGGYFDTERGPGGVVDFSAHNVLGSARIIGARTRYDADLREARIYFSQPLLEHFPLKTTATTFFRKDLLEQFTAEQIGLSVQQETRFGDHFLLNYGYRLARTHTRDRNLDALIPLDVILRVAPLTASISRDTRDEFLDATRGSFASQALEWSTHILGSQLHVARFFGQYFHFLPLSEPVEVPWIRRYRPRLVYASGIRVGLVGGLGGQVVPLSERFFAGGGTSVRGFEQNKLGPLDGTGAELGGNAMLVINNELRFPLFSIFDGVGFVDVGNVYPRIADFSITDIRKTGGIGLRARTPYFLLRLDYGVKFDRRPGEGRGRLFFSIGQAF